MQVEKWITRQTSQYRKWPLFMILSFLCTGYLFAQENQNKKELADEYFKRENYAKALEIYEDLAGNPQTDVAIFGNLMKCLEKEKPAKVEPTLRKFIKRNPDQFTFYTYQYKYLKEKEGPKEQDKFTTARWIPWMLKSQDRIYQGFNFFTQNDGLTYRSQLLEQAIKIFGFRQFWKQMLQIQLASKSYTESARTVMQILADRVTGENELESFIQEYVTDPAFSKQLQIDLLKQIQARPSAQEFPAFLGWLYLQERDYEGALAQYQALDLLQNTAGARVYQLGEFAINNEETRLAIKCFEFVIQNFPATPNRFQAQQKLIQLREELVKNTYPVRKEEVKALIEEYSNLTNSQFLNAYDLTLKIAELCGKFLNRPDTAIQILESSLKNRRWPANYQNKAKVMIADMYILKNEPWEASLLYGQVEKDEAESLIGYEAKLKNAKVFYFKGEFELCQEQLDVLKMSTSRDISNDAIELGLLLQDILAEDTTGYFLSKFADIDLLAFQGNYMESISQIQALTGTISNPVVLEKLKYRLFKNYSATRQFTEALQQLDEVFKTKASDLYMDDALFYSGNIYMNQLKDKEKAMSYFLKLIKEYPGSVFVAEARKKLRILRGDSLN